MMSKDRERTHSQRLGYVLDDKELRGVEIAGRLWGTWMGTVAVFPDYVGDIEVNDDHFKPLPPGVRLASTNYDGMVVLR